MNNIEAAITEIDTGKLDDETKKGKTAFAIVATFGSILDKLPKLVDQRNRPKVSHLILQRNIAKARLDYANKIIALEQKRIDDRMAYLHAVEKEFTEWEVTRKSLCAVIGSAPCTLTDAKTALASDGVRTIFSDKTASQLKNDAFSALSVWGAARRGHRGAQKGLFWSMHLEKKERSLALSERALAIRSTLISSSLDQIATYHALGVKQEDLVRLVTGIVQLGTTIGILGTVQ